MEETLQLLLRQHVGAPCKPIVAAGAHVQRGQLIAVPEGLGANLFSSAAGTVTEILPDRINIKADAEQPEGFVPIKDGTKLEMITEAGIVGMGGAGFPTGIKLKTPIPGGYVLINAAECEPGLVHNIRQIEKEAEKIVRGVRHVMEITQAKEAIFAIKKKNEAAVKRLRDAIKNEADMRIHLLADIYPMGEERAVVRECLGIELGTTQLPSAANAVVLNVETIARITEAIEEHKPCFSKNMTVVGKLVGGNAPHVFYDVPVGTSVGTMIEKAGGIDGIYGEIIMGGPFTGRAVELDAPVTKTTGGIIVTIDLPDLHGAKIGILNCACGGNEARMRDICAKMHGEVVSICRCKQAVENKPGAPLKCERPGICPGQAQNSIKFKKDHCEYILVGNCSDCTNTVMGSAPKMGLKVFHQTDHVMRTIGHPLYRFLKVSREVEQLPNGK